MRRPTITFTTALAGALFLAGCDACAPMSVDAGATPADAGETPNDAGRDAGDPPADAGVDAGDAPVDAGPQDGGSQDAGGTQDAGQQDAGQEDAGQQDAGPPIDPIADAGAAVLIDETFDFLEGPVWRAADGWLLFTDIPQNRIYRLVPPSTVDVFREPSNNANGLATDADGLLIAAEHGARRVSRTQADGGVVAVATTWDGGAFNSPNDLVARADGTLFFTDPPYGLDGRPREIPFNGVFRVTPGGAVVAEWQGALATRPNGVTLSPAADVLYVADTAGGVVRAYDVATDGSLSGESTFADVPSPDGMAVDEAGNLFVTASDGVRVLAPDGSPWGTIDVGRTPANCAFGDADRRTLYITAREGLYRVRTAIPGVIAP